MSSHKLSPLALPFIAVALAGCGSATASTPSVAKPAAPAPQKAAVLIRHQTAHCHAWSVNGGPFAASQVVHLTPGSTLTVTDQDVMSHTLIQTGGPALSITDPLTNMHQVASVRFARPGTYVFKTKAGEDYMSGIQTTGADNQLRLTVIVSQ